MKKISVLLIAFLILGATSLSATITRDAGMGLTEVPWMLDGLQGSVYLNPAYVTDFKNRVFFDRTGFENGLNSGGIFWNPVAGLTVGIVSGLPVSNSLWNTTAGQSLYYQGNYDSKVGAYDPGAGATNFDISTLDSKELSLIDPDPTDDDYKRINLNQQAFRIVSGYDFGNMQAGVSFGFSSGWTEDSFNDGTDQDSYTLSEVEYSTIVGGTLQINDMMDLGLDVTFKYYDLENAYDVVEAPLDYKLSYESDGAMDILVGVNYNLKIGTMQKIHTRVQYGFLNRSTVATIKNLEPATDEKITEDFQRLGHEVRFGVSDEMTINKHITLFVGINAVYNLFTYKANAVAENTTESAINNDRYKGDATTVQIPLYVGLELRPHKNFEFRVGLSHVIYNLAMIDSSFSDYTPAPTDSTATSEWSENINNSNTTELALGLTWKFYDVRLDWVLNVDMFTRGPDFISGYSMQKGVNNDGSTPMATSFAVSYSFDSLWNKVSGQ